MIGIDVITLKFLLHNMQSMTTIEELEQRITKLEAENAELRKEIKIREWRVTMGLCNSTTELDQGTFWKYIWGEMDSQYKG